MIQTCISGTAFLFKDAATRRTLARLPFDTLLLHQGDASPEELDEVRFLAQEFTPGQVVVTPTKQEVVLGPPQDYRYEVALHGCGNPDHQQYADIAPKTIVKLVDVADAVAVVLAFQDRNDMGCGNCSPAHGWVWTTRDWAALKRKKVGRVNYGGRYQTVAEIKAQDAAFKAQYPKL